MVLALSSCVEDEGNYTYRTLNEVTIEEETTPIYVLAYVDEIEIAPTVTGTIDGEDLSNYSFQWHLCLNGDHDHIMLGNEKDLKWDCSVSPGTYTLYLTVVDNTTGLETLYSRSVILSSPFSRGFLILGEDMASGEGRMDMLAMPVDKDTTYISDVMEDHSILKDPEMLIYAGKANWATEAYIDRQQKLFVTTANGCNEITSGDKYEQKWTLDNGGIIEIPAIPHITPMRVIHIFPEPCYGRNRSTMYRGYLTDDMMFFDQSIISDYHTVPLNHYSTTSNTYFKPAPYMWYSRTYPITSLSIFVAYDMDGEKFVLLPTSAFGLKQCTDMALSGYDKAGDPWSWNLGSEGRTLVYGENDTAGSYGMSDAIVKDGNGNYYIYRFTVPTSAYAAFVKNGLYTIDPKLAPDFDKASHYAFLGAKSVVLYSVGNRVYQYNYVNPKCDYIDFDDEVTYLAAQYMSNGSKDEFFVATYGSQNLGNLYKYEVGSNPNTIEFALCEGQAWPSTIKIKDIVWKDGY